MGSAAFPFPTTAAHSFSPFPPRIIVPFTVGEPGPPGPAPSGDSRASWTRSGQALFSRGEWECWGTGTSSVAFSRHCFPSLLGGIGQWHVQVKTWCLWNTVCCPLSKTNTGKRKNTIFFCKIKANGVMKSWWLMAGPKSRLKIMFAESRRTIAITSYCL